MEHHFDSTISTCRATNHGCHGNIVGNNKYLNGRKKNITFISYFK